MKKNIVLMLICMMAVTVNGCGSRVEMSKGNDGEDKYLPSEEISEGDIDSDDIDQYVDYETDDSTEEESNSDAVLDDFLNGDIGAYELETSDQLYITDLNFDEDEWDSFEVGDKVDLDNDGENEQILKGPYGGMYIDVQNGEAYILDSGSGTSDVLSYVDYNGEIWIAHTNNMNVGYECYSFVNYFGGDTEIDSITLCAEAVNPDDENSEMTYTKNDEEISQEEYESLLSEMTAEEYSTSK